MYFDDMSKEILSPKNFIYALHHPTSRCVYVGQTSRGMLRPRSHFWESCLNSTRKVARSKWIKSMRARGHEPEIAILEECADIAELDDAERFHIVSMRALGFTLLNHTEGGGGIRGYRHTEECKKASAERMKRRIASDPNYSAKCSERNRRLYEDPNYRARMSEAMKQRAAADPNYSAKMSTVSKSQWTEKARKKKSLAMLGNKRSATPEARAAASAANKGKPKSAEARAKMSEAKRRRWQDPVYRARQIAAQKKAHGTPEARTKAAEWAKLAGHEGHRTAEYRARTSARVKAHLATPKVQAQRSEQTTRLWETDAYRDKVTQAITVAQRRRRLRERGESEE